MPRYFKLRDGHDWMWFDVLDSEDAVESFARSIESADGITVDRSDIVVYRYPASYRVQGVSRLEYTVGRHYWVASREST